MLGTAVYLAEQEAEMNTDNKSSEEVVSDAVKEAHALCREALRRLLAVAPEVSKFKSRASQRNTAEHLGDSLTAILRVCHDGPLVRAANWAVKGSLPFDRDEMDAVVHSAVKNLR